MLWDCLLESISDSFFGVWVSILKLFVVFMLFWMCKLNWLIFRFNLLYWVGIISVLLFDKKGCLVMLVVLILFYFGLFI